MAQSLSDLSTVWNSAGTAFNGIKLNVTDTASAAGSNLLDLLVGGTSQFSVAKTGGMVAKNFIVLQAVGTTDRWALLNTSGMAQRNTAYYGWGSGANDAGGAPDLTLFRDAANTFAQRNGTNAQAFRVYNTFTDASNYERGYVRWNSNVFEIGTEAAGTGQARQLTITSSGALYVNPGSTFELRRGGANSGLRIGDTASVDPLGASATSLGQTTARWNNLFQAGFHEMVEMTAPAAPAANGVRIYAEDDGAGKTRLMARFATGAAVQLAIEP